jgi:hypothetical protein
VLAMQTSRDAGDPASKQALGRGWEQGGRRGACVRRSSPESLVLESGEPAAGEGADGVDQHLNPYF